MHPTACRRFGPLPVSTVSEARPQAWQAARALSRAAAASPTRERAGPGRHSVQAAPRLRAGGAPGRQGHRLSSLYDAGSVEAMLWGLMPQRGKGIQAEGRQARRLFRDRVVREEEEGIVMATQKLGASSSSSMTMVNKAPHWNEQLRCWCLNFKGRVKLASVKNFQLVCESDMQTIVMQARCPTPHAWGQDTAPLHPWCPSLACPETALACGEKLPGSHVVVSRHLVQPGAGAPRVSTAVAGMVGGASAVWS